MKSISLPSIFTGRNQPCPFKGENSLDPSLIKLTCSFGSGSPEYNCLGAGAHPEQMRKIIKIARIETMTFRNIASLHAMDELNIVDISGNLTYKQVTKL